MTQSQVELSAASVSQALDELATPEKAQASRRYFKAEPGGYGEGDIFIGCTVPQARSNAKRFRDLPLDELDILLDSPIHECRLTALHILVDKFQRAKTRVLRGELFDFYVGAVKRGRVNNWDLVDTSAPYLGVYLVEHPMKTLILRMSESANLWERRTAMMFTFAHIRAGEYGVPQHIAMKLLHDDHDLIHKAVGWMLREIGNRDLEVLRAFLAKHHREMPRTTLRYAIEKLAPEERKRWMAR